MTLAVEFTLDASSCGNAHQPEQARGAPQEMTSTQKRTIDLVVCVCVCIVNESCSHQVTLHS